VQPDTRPRRRDPLRVLRGSGPLRRDPHDRLAGGVAAGLARRSGLDVTTIRIVFVVVALITGGLGVAAYVLAWLLLPAGGQPAGGQQASIASRAARDRAGIALAAGIGSLITAAALIAPSFGDGWLAGWAWWQAISLAGLVLIWRNAPAEEKATMRRYAEPLQGLAEDSAGAMGRKPALRFLAAGVLFLAGVIWLLSGHESVAMLRPLGGMALVVAGAAVVLAPWWLRIARDLITERQARVRAEERADMASRVHDSVLQTLALIQRRADQPQQVIALARAQERELRSWLFEGRAPGQQWEEAETFAAGVRLIQQEVEAQHGVSVEVVTVGDCALDDGVAAMLAAGQEATVNAAKWSGADVVSLFAEVQPGEVSLIVRDRGRGFDPAKVDTDRRGLAESIRGRMTRRGGTATVTSAPGEGTKVVLTVPRAAEASRA
jgi:signal transduction histidine kinase